MGSTSRPAQGLAQEYSTNIMKDFAKWVLWAVVVIVIAVVISIAVIGSKKPGTLSAITSPQTTLDYLVLTQGLGFGALGTQPVTMAGARTTFSSTTFVPCALQNPYTSTSTINDFSVAISVGTSTTNTFVVGTSTTATGTSTTPFITQLVGGGFTPTISFGAGTNNAIVGPSQWITVGYTNASLATGVQVTGVCSATFQSTI